MILPYMILSPCIFKMRIAVTWLESILRDVPKSLAVADQLDRASTSIPLNIAEGNGKFTGADRCRYFDNAHGSALECAAALDVLVAKGRSPSQDVVPGKTRFRLRGVPQKSETRAANNFCETISCNSPSCVASC